jgi:FlaA1/EpsC-like NDP-sugar epimerase
MIKKSIISEKINFEDDLVKNESFICKNILNKKIIVIGGAGTIGSNYIKQILKFKPKKLTVVDINENGLTELTRDLRSSKLLDYNPDYITYPVNLLSTTFEKIFNTEIWHVVANFSAHKHVRSEKDVISVEALIKNNVFGAIKLLNLCELNPPKFFFSVSTDKAANPVNIMGASKSLMERLIISKKQQFRVSTARFANVAFSNGSLLDGFIYRLQKHQPLSCPSDIKRFFVNPKQSGQICLLSTFLGESGNVFFPKLDFNNDQIYFKDIAIDFLKENNFKPFIVQSEKEAKEFDFKISSEKYPIYFFESDTSGEKTYEEFYTEDEDYVLDRYNSLGYINSIDEMISFEKVTFDFNSIFSNPNCSKLDIISVIKKYVPGFVHIETGKNLDQKM